MTTSLRDHLFIENFLNMQASADAINRRNSFTAEDDLITQFEEFISAPNVRSDVKEKFLPLVPAFRNARIGLKLMLVAGELGELLEAFRKNKATDPDSHCPEFTNEEVELADVVIRAMNYATDRNLRLAEAIAAKNEFNLLRPDHQPENRAKENGKKF